MSRAAQEHLGLGYARFGLDHGIGHLACMSPQKNERLTFSKG